MNINNIKNNPVAIGVLALVVGLVIGYICGDRRDFRGDWHKGSRGAYEYGMHGAMNGMMMGVSGKAGDDLDRAFLEGMIVHHEGAISMSQELLRGTQRPELIKLGNEIISAQTKEIEMMKGWKAEWFK